MFPNAAFTVFKYDLIYSSLLRDSQQAFFVFIKISFVVKSEMQRPALSSCCLMLQKYLTDSNDLNLHVVYKIRNIFCLLDWTTLTSFCCETLIKVSEFLLYIFTSISYQHLQVVYRLRCIMLKVRSK